MLGSLFAEEQVESQEIIDNINHAGQSYGFFYNKRYYRQ